MLIVYRACNSELDGNVKPERPEWFSKFNCFNSLVNSMGNTISRHTLVVIFDGDDTTTYAKHLRDNCNEFVNIDYRNNGLSILSCFEYAKNNHLDDKYIYFVEDDYLHTADAIHILEGALEKFSDKLITLYDHLDRYTRSDDITKDKESIYITQDCHWRTSESTTCTYAISRDLFNQIYDDLAMFSNQDRPMFRHLITRGIRVITSLPGHSTHVNKFFFAPFTNWKTLNYNSDEIGSPASNIVFFPAQEKRIKNYCFMTVGAYNDYQETINHIFASMKSSGLYDELDEILVFTDGPVNLPNDSKITIDLKKKEDYEFSALKAAKRFCNDLKENARVLYVHSKGSSKAANDRQKPFIKDWFKLMTYFNIEKYKKCFEVLEDSDACGVNLHKVPTTPYHFSGNFWWANSEYIKSLNFIETERAIYPGFEKRFNAEFWIGTGNDAKLISLFNSNVDHYSTPFPENLYKTD